MFKTVLPIAISKHKSKHCQIWEDHDPYFTFQSCRVIVVAGHRWPHRHGLEEACDNGTDGENPKPWTGR